MAIIDKKMKRYKQRIQEAKDKYRTNELKKPLKRRNSLPVIKNAQTEEDRDIQMAFISKYQPYTLEFNPFEEKETKTFEFIPQ